MKKKKKKKKNENHVKYKMRREKKTWKRGVKERLGGPARWMLKTKANTERNSIGL
jgi:hypothetical protein